ncbi:MAG TPA: hypothetical protein VJ727_03200 [Rhodanobacteraceae bacterium]|nr:hypothetical protein [Rhodanobacteraceae bacterium]
MENYKLDYTFPRLYECDLLTETVDHMMPHFYFPGATTEGGSDGVLVKVHPRSGGAWLGTFAFGEYSQRGMSGLFSTPDPERFCVVAGGAGYLVTASDPKLHENLEIKPITDIRPILARNLIVFADFTQLLAYGPHGREWKSDRIAWDGLQICKITDSAICGEFWDVAKDMNAHFVVNLSDGMKKSRD